MSVVKGTPYGFWQQGLPAGAENQALQAFFLLILVLLILVPFVVPNGFVSTFTSLKYTGKALH